MAHLARRAQALEGLGDLLGLHQRIRAMQQQDVQALGPRPLQAGLDRLDDVAAGQVVAAWALVVGEADAALALQHDAVAQRGLAAEQFAEHRLGLAAGVDVGVVEQRHADVERGLDGRLRMVDMGVGPRGVVPVAAQAHAAIGEWAGGREVLLQRKGVAHGGACAFWNGERAPKGARCGIVTRRAGAAFHGGFIARSSPAAQRSRRAGQDVDTPRVAGPRDLQVRVEAHVQEAPDDAEVGAAVFRQLGARVRGRAA